MRILLTVGGPKVDNEVEVIAKLVKEKLRRRWPQRDGRSGTGGHRRQQKKNIACTLQAILSLDTSIYVFSDLKRWE